MRVLWYGRLQALLQYRRNPIENKKQTQRIFVRILYGKRGASYCYLVPDLRGIVQMYVYIQARTYSKYCFRSLVAVLPYVVRFVGFYFPVRGTDTDV